MKNIIEKLYKIKSKGVSLKRDTKAYNYKYATLDQIQEKLNPILEELKLVVSHRVKDNKVITQVFDLDSGESIESGIDINTTKPQDQGSEITYYRRYNLVCLFDLEVEDDDGKKAQDSKNFKSTSKNVSKTNTNREEDSKKVFTEETFLKLAKSKSVYVDSLGALADLNGRGYEVSKEFEEKIKVLYGD